MKVIADLHIHSPFSSGTSRSISLERLVHFATHKGVNLLGTGDFLQPRWLKECKKTLQELDVVPGIYQMDPGRKVFFLVAGEVSVCFETQNKSKKIHILILCSDFAVAEQLQSRLRRFGDLEDGRPELDLTPPELVELVKETDQNAELVPCHIFTSWYSVLGQHGFDCLQDCFEDKTKDLLALETGLSADPLMAFRISELDAFPLISNSDLHSPWPYRLGREANVFELEELSYYHVRDAIKQRDPTHFRFTLELDPRLGKYYHTGHRKDRKYRIRVKRNRQGSWENQWIPHEHDVIFTDPKLAMACGNLCPCGQKLTIGVLQRVEELADREMGYIPLNIIPFKTVIPLMEIISKTTHAGLFSKLLWDKYVRLTRTFGNELNVLLSVPYESLRVTAGNKLSEAILRVREGRITISPGFDGVYGTLNILSNTELAQDSKKSSQKS
ncbi:MAG: endonuclease Q family protein [Candidatus Heimdallarchaeota archaeon]